MSRLIYRLRHSLNYYFPIYCVEFFASLIGIVTLGFCFPNWGVNLAAKLRKSERESRTSFNAENLTLTVIKKDIDF